LDYILDLELLDVITEILSSFLTYCVHTSISKPHFAPPAPQLWLLCTHKSSVTHIPYQSEENK